MPSRGAYLYIYTNLGYYIPSRSKAIQYVYADLSELQVDQAGPKRLYIAGKVPGGTLDALGLH